MEEGRKNSGTNIIGKRKRGKLRRIWYEEVKEAVESGGIKWQDIKKIHRREEDLKINMNQCNLKIPYTIRYKCVKKNKNHNLIAFPRLFMKF